MSTHNHTIYNLRKNGFKVRVQHLRHYKTAAYRSMCGTGPSYKTLSGKGGYTKIEVTTPDGQTTVLGEAICHENDPFNRKLGNKIALGRALKQLVTV